LSDEQVINGLACLQAGRYLSRRRGDLPSKSAKPLKMANFLC
jgi:hypothetical protein